jgi:uncharacterized protein YjbJ (UPF0337 family)
MEIKQNIYKIHWSEYKQQVHLHWSKLTEDDLSRLNGGADDFISILRKRYGYGKAQAEIEITKWLNEMNITPLRSKSKGFEGSDSESN